MPHFPFDVIAFDLDGTLADTAPDLCAALNHTLGMLGRPPIAPEALRHMVGHGVRALVTNGLAATGPVTDALVDEGVPIMTGYYEANIAVGTRPFEGVEHALDELAAMGVRMAVCTNKLEGLARELIHALGWDGRFAAIVGGDTVATRKPDPLMLHEAIRIAGGGRAAFVGDSIVDVDTARAATILCVAVSFGFSDRPPEELGADRLIDHFDALLPALRSLG